MFPETPNDRKIANESQDDLKRSTTYIEMESQTYPVSQSPEIKAELRTIQGYASKREI